MDALCLKRSTEYRNALVLALRTGEVLGSNSVLDFDYISFVSYRDFSVSLVISWILFQNISLTLPFMSLQAYYA